MANLDTREKRASGAHVALPWRALLPLPDGALSQADRQQAATMYAGILATAGVSRVAVAERWAASVRRRQRNRSRR